MTGSNSPTPEELELFNSLEAEYLAQVEVIKHSREERKEAAEKVEYKRLKKKFGDV